MVSQKICTLNWIKSKDLNLRIGGGEEDEEEAAFENRTHIMSMGARHPASQAELERKLILDDDYVQSDIP